MAKTIFDAGNPATSTKGTKVTAAFLNAMQNHRHDGANADGSCPNAYANAAGGVNAYTVDLTPVLAGHVTGMPLYFIANNANNGAATVNFNSLGAKAIKDTGGNALVLGSISAGQVVAVIYDGVNYQMISARSTIDPAYAYILVVDQKSSGTSPASISGGGWRTRELNTIKANSGGYVSVASNQITLPAGTYRCRASAPAHDCGCHKIRVQNITAGTTLIVGSAERTYVYVGFTHTLTRSEALGQFTLAAPSVLEIQHYVADTNPGGYASSFEVEIYATIELIKIV